MRRREFIGLLASVAAASFWPLCARAQQPKRRNRHKLSLAAAQRAEIWRSLGEQAMKTQIPAGLHVGEVVPGTMHLLSFARDLRKKIPAIRHHLYVLLQGEVLIIDPRTKRIVAIVGA